MQWHKQGPWVRRAAVNVNVAVVVAVGVAVVWLGSICGQGLMVLHFIRAML